jgi:hypothetical protein
MMVPTQDRRTGGNLPTGSRNFLLVARELWSALPAEEIQRFD